MEFLSLGVVVILMGFMAYVSNRPLTQLVQSSLGMPAMVEVCHDLLTGSRRDPTIDIV